MAQVMHFDAIPANTSMDKKTYAVNFKGLIAHLLDIMFTDNSEQTFYANDLSGHMQKDIGLNR
ncbi:hypothetical protein [Vibrio sonorensis]|uniref:hypothetical protein n=1 Tax=Vibrio sonorensis TaxID=1004316 RepID=UPI0008D95D98|nr:hypothetical protein [Vibrio sonorensis]